MNAFIGGSHIAPMPPPDLTLGCRCGVTLSVWQGEGSVRFQHGSNREATRTFYDRGGEGIGLQAWLSAVHAHRQPPPSAHGVREDTPSRPCPPANDQRQRSDQGSAGSVRPGLRAVTPSPGTNPLDLTRIVRTSAGNGNGNAHSQGESVAAAGAQNR